MYKSVQYDIWIGMMQYTNRYVTSEQIILKAIPYVSLLYFF